MGQTKPSFTRWNIPRDPRNPRSHINSGYEGATSDEYTIPSCGIRDVDEALFYLFDRDIGFVTTKIHSQNKLVDIAKPYVILAAGERFADAKNLRPPRDSNKALMLPAISIRRTGIQQTAEDMTGRGMNQNTGAITIRRRLDTSDRDYQALLNKLAFKNLSTTVDTRREEKNGESPRVNLATSQGTLLDSNIGNNVFEMIVVPQPQFYTLNYEIIFWTHYAQHMNYLISTLMSSYLPQDKMFQLNTDSGYWFLAHVQDELSSQENFDDYTEQKRIVRYSFNIEVKAFLFATNGPGNPVPIRRWVSAPQISFELAEVPAPGGVNSESPVVDGSKFLLTDIDRDPQTAQTSTTNDKTLFQKEVLDPVSKKKKFIYAKIIESNQRSGETVYYTSGINSLDEFLLAIKASN